jgi:2-polyprenyl-6-methoxyphenol hydroxylase-like FAD-dependent oxidoreductase
MADVLIAGAGPTGLVLALWLTQQGVTVRIVDKDAGPGETSRAMAVQARTLELYRQLDLADPVIAAGHENVAINLWARGKHQARLSFGDAGASVTPYPFVLVYPQDQHERLLIDKLATMGVEVERHTELIDFEDKGDHVSARLRLPDQSDQTCVVRYIAGCDGAKSTVRHQLGMGFEGGTYKHLFYVADVELEGLASDDEVHVSLENGDFVIVLSYGFAGQQRLIGAVQDERAERADTLTFDDVGHEALKRLGLGVRKVNWFSTYHVHHRMADDFQRGRVFLLGDAAHIHSPAGGQGMNTGILDAINLAWKLAEVLKGSAPAGLLDSYGLERRAFARKLVDTTDRVFTLVTKQGDFADFVRNHILPTVASVAYSIDEVRSFMFRTISQATLSYRESPLSRGKAGGIHGGDRLPWVRTASTDNYDSLKLIGWQIHVYGAARPELQAWCEAHRLPLQVFDWHAEHHAAGVSRDAIYLLRPDTFVALADDDASSETLQRYLASQGFMFKKHVSDGLT